jgi:hypothetical protein
MTVTVRIGTLVLEGEPDEAALRRAVEAALRAQAPQLRAAQPAIAEAVATQVARSTDR